MEQSTTNINDITNSGKISTSIENNVTKMIIKTMYRFLVSIKISVTSSISSVTLTV